MVEHAPNADAEVVPPVTNNSGHGNGAPALDSIEARLRRLEDAVAGLQESRRAAATVVASAAPSDGNSGMIDASRRLLPLAMGMMRTSMGPVPPLATPVAVEQALGSQQWLVLEAYHDIRAIGKMFVDRRYRVRWSTWVVPIGVVAAMLLSWMILGSIWIVGPWLDKIVDLILAFLAYKVLVREAQRYRATMGYAAPPRRL